MRRVAVRAKMMRPRATTQLTAMELVIGNPNTLPISTALAERPCSSGVVWGMPPCANDDRSLLKVTSNEKTEPMTNIRKFLGIWLIGNYRHRNLWRYWQK